MWWLIPIGTFVLGFFAGVGAILWSIGKDEVLMRKNPETNEYIHVIRPSRP